MKEPFRINPKKEPFVYDVSLKRSDLYQYSPQYGETHGYATSKHNLWDILQK
jgi:hypothetical protein